MTFTHLLVALAPLVAARALHRRRHLLDDPDLHELACPRRALEWGQLTR